MLKKIYFLIPILIFVVFISILSWHVISRNAECRDSFSQISIFSTYIECDSGQLLETVKIDGSNFVKCTCTNLSN